MARAALAVHRWDATPAEAKEIQIRLRDRMERDDRISAIRKVAGADLALVLEGRRSWANGRGKAIAGMIVYEFPEMKEMERVSCEQTLTFPYVPGLLSFREIPALLAAFAKLHNAPDLIFCDGLGYAHPRRFGLASHLGVLLDLPSVGVAKSLYIGEHGELHHRQGSTAPLIDPDGGETIGAALRTVDGVKPVYVSQGHRISLARAIELTQAVSEGYRIPKPTREADHYVNALRRAKNSGTADAAAAGAPRAKARAADKTRE